MAVTLALLDLKQIDPQQINVQQKTSLKQWRFETAIAIRVGRSPENDVVLDNPVVSRQHLELRQAEDSSWRLISRGTNGTFVNGTFVNDTLALKQQIEDGALIQLAKDGPILEFRIENQEVSINQSPSLSSNSQPCTHEGNPPNTLFCIHCGEPIHVERNIRQYKVLRILGQGGMGTTYLACRPSGSGQQRYEILVLKEMNADMTRIPKAIELFEREARVLQSLRHPGIPQFFDFFVAEGRKYLAMEMIHGTDLEKQVEKYGPVATKQAIEWMIQTCEVLEYIHSEAPPIIHRDIKPANLLVRSLDRRVVVLDFGAVKEIGTPLGTCIGAPDYTAPEQNRGEPVAQSDLYGVGATLIFLLTGESPQKFFELSKQGWRFNLKNDPRIAPELRATIEKATHAKPRDRYLTAAEMSRALADCLS